jgi:hypothetical protein
MSERKPRQNLESPSVADHAAPSAEPQFTGWHYFLVQALQKLRSDGLDVHGFVKLGSLPLEADVIILHLHKDADLTLFSRYFGFLVPSLRPFLLIEYKGPDDRLTLADFDTVRAYAMLCKRKYGVARDADLSVAMLYSRTEAGFFAGCADHGFPFVEAQPGVWQSCQQALRYYALDLVVLGEQQPEHPINLLSARRHGYRTQGLMSGLGPFAVLYEEVFLKELKKMSQMQVPGSKELLDDAERLDELVLSRASVERRLRGIAPEEILGRFSPEERLAGLPPEERLRGLPPEERLRGLSPSEKAKLRELLLKSDRH